MTFVAYAHTARNFPIAVVFRKYGAGWWHVLLWKYRDSRIDTGAWFRGALYPRCSNISPDGQLLAYFALKHQGRDESEHRAWPASYFAISKVPWLTALAAWEVAGTWSSGSHFTNKKLLHIDAMLVVSTPFYGSWPGGVTTSFTSPRGGLPGSMFVDQGGWSNLEILPESVDAIWRDMPVAHEPTLAAYVKKVPRSEWLLVKATRKAIPNERAIELLVDHYELIKDGETFRFPEKIIWADLSKDGELLALTDRGSAQVWLLRGSRDATPDLISSVQIGVEEPNPQPSPEWSQHW